MEREPPETAREKQVRLAIAGIVVLFLAYITLASLWAFTSTFFLAIFAYVILKPLYVSLRSRGLGKTSAGITAMLIGAVVIGIPCVILFAMLANETLHLINNTTFQPYVTMVDGHLSTLQKMFPDTNVSAAVNEALIGVLSAALNALKSLVLSVIQNVGKLMLDLLILIFTLYYLLVSEGSLGKFGRSLIPFNRKNTEKLASEFKKVTYSVLICTGLMAIVQAVPLMLVFMYYGVPAAVFFGIIAAVLACIPFTGVPFVWVPIVLAEIMQKNYDAAMGISVIGLIVFGIENLRPVIQNRIGQLHPLISILGIIIGLQYFGIMGVLIGPLLLSYTLLTMQMFKEEYA
ncbi:AI-2E family transporter [Candidatus Burarchaeum australiense]|nr:AI-2E family transporter [Candidatus Burarchaeum australiense]